MNLHARLPDSTAAAAMPWPTVETRFGLVSYDPGKVITLPRGLLGFHDYQEFILIDPPNQPIQQFKLLQCVTRPAFGLFVLPLDDQDAALDARDRAETCERLGIAPADAVFVLVVTIRHTGDGLTLSANQRAPIVIDTRNLIAYQYVMPNDKYEIRRPLQVAR